MNLLKRGRIRSPYFLLVLMARDGEFVKKRVRFRGGEVWGRKRGMKGDEELKEKAVFKAIWWRVLVAVLVAIRETARLPGNSIRAFMCAHGCP